ncbi:MAG: undecaprenyl/decaprenyl-phosphate alpha-N-acetylglucosaminyl 1-phosphate transferase [Ruminiclostridium sp.]|nr:undecaprenyl/decaprenyl-phosphate alpha-N-acetylglucosaminyl 1-phosphate transferase [Ruminiclostridium sp.]
MIMELPAVAWVVMALVVAMLIAFIATPVVKSLAEKVGAVDVPKDNRRMHKHPIPRMGGLAIFLGFLLSTLLFVPLTTPLRGMLIGSVIIVILGIIDDIHALPALPKLLVQIVAALVAVLHGNVIEVLSNPNIFSDNLYWVLGPLAVPVSVIWIVAITNAVNLIDGLDGLAVGVATISSITMLVIAMLVSDNVVAMMMAALAGGCIGFLPYNHNPAKIFMGDTGSTFLGFVLATVSIQGLFKFYTIISFAVPFLMLGLPLFDTCFAILRRLSKGQNPMSPDRSHVHHRLIDMGFNQKQAVAILYVISAILGLSAVVLTTSGALKAMLLLCALCFAGLIAARISMSHVENQEKTEETKEAAENGAESHDDFRDPPGGSEDGSAGEGTGEQTGD